MTCEFLFKLLTRAADAEAFGTRSRVGAALVLALLRGVAGAVLAAAVARIVGEPDAKRSNIIERLFLN